MTRRGEGNEGHVDPFAGVPELDERICEWVDGCLSDRERARFEAELRVSPELRRQLADYEASVADVREALQQPIVESSIADQVMARIASGEERTAELRTSRSAWPVAWALAAAAAALALVVWIDELGALPATAQVADSAPAPDAPIPEADVLIAEMDLDAADPRAQLDEVTGRMEAAESSPKAAAAEPELLSAGAAKPRAKRAEQRGGGYGGRFGGRRARAPSGPATAGPTPEGAQPPARAAAAVPMPLVTFDLDAGAAATLAAWAGDAPGPRPADATPESAAAREYEAALTRAWFAKEALRALAGSRAVATAAPTLRGLRLAPAPAGDGSPEAASEWFVEGEQGAVQRLLATLAAAAGPLDARVRRGEVTRRPPASDPQTRDTDEAASAPARLVVRFGSKR